MRIDRDGKTYGRIMQALETAFLALAGLYMVFRLSQSTTFHLIWPGWFEPMVMRGLFAVALARLVTSRLWRRETLIAVGMALVYLLVYRGSGYTFLLYLALFTVGFIDIDYRKILKTYLATVGVFYCVTMLAGMMGVITNYVSVRSGRGTRSAWGMSYYTDFASLGLFIAMALWVAWKKLPDWAMLFVCIGYMLLPVCVAHSNTSTICAALLLCAILYHWLECRLSGKCPGVRWTKKGSELFATFGFPLLALVMFAFMVLYARNTHVGDRLNSLLTNRLSHSVNAWRAYGLKPFGTPFQQRGAGFSTLRSSNYNFVDSTYPLILIRYGWVTLLALTLSWGWTARKAIRGGDRRLVLVMGIIAIHAFSEHHFIDSHFNILVAMPLAAYLPVKVGETAAGEGPVGKLRNRFAPWGITALLFVAGAWLAGPALLSWMKTVLEFRHLGHGEHALRLIVVLLGALCGVCLAAWAVSRLIGALMTRAGARAWRPAAAVLLLCALAGGGLWLYADRTIDAAARENEAMVAADREALEIAARAATGGVRSGVLPAVYAREIEGVGYAAFFEDDLARLSGDTVLMPSDTEHASFFENGFLYVPISEAHALYTGDRAVAEALADAGYHPTGYYSTEMSVDMADAAERNALSYDPQTGLRLGYDEQDMGNGPWRDIYAGQYTLTWELSLPEGADRDAGRVCTLRVTGSKGEIMLLKRDVRAEEFDEQGKLSVVVSLDIKDNRNVAFEAWAEAGRQVDIVRIGFVRTPEYDVHTYYDAKLRKIREEYYRLDGTRQLRKDGWFACDYSYDRYGNKEWLRYYDCDGHLTLNDEGYAQRKGFFNAKKKMVREELYGVDDRLIVCAKGYAADEREYDSAGNVVVQRYYGPDGQPVLTSDGYAEVRRDYNDRQQVVRERYYGLDGALTPAGDGYASVEFEYDGDALIRKRYFDPEGVLLREAAEE